MRESDPQKLDALVGRLVGDVGACVTGSLIVLGDQLGLYKAMADGEPVTAAELASRTGADTGTARLTGTPRTTARPRSSHPAGC